MEFGNHTEEYISPEEDLDYVKIKTQVEFLEMSGGRAGDDSEKEWVTANRKRFMELFNDPQFNFYNRLIDNETHAGALEELKQKLYN